MSLQEQWRVVRTESYHASSTGLAFRHGPESRRRPAFPVGAQGRRLALEVKHDHLGEDLPVPPIPLEGKLDVGPGRVAVLKRIMTQVITVVGHRRTMKELEKTDGHVSMNLRHPARADLKLGVKPVTTFVGMVIPGTGILLEPLPFVPAGQIAAIRRRRSSRSSTCAQSRYF